MLSKFVGTFAKRAPQLARPSMLAAYPVRSMMNKLGLHEHMWPEDQAVMKQDDGQVDLWKAYTKENTSLALKSTEDIEKYVISVVKGYFRTVKKASLTVDSTFTDHGLDKLDVIELIIQVEDDLGYVIDGENLEKFQSPRHFINFIEHMEAYKKEHNKLPHEQTHAEFNFKEAFPGMPGGH